MAKAKSGAEMVEVVLAVPRTGPNGAQNRGDTITVSAAEAKRMAAAGQLMDGDEVETATAAAPGSETAAT